jgi:Uma2 family endonuclease
MDTLKTRPAEGSDDIVYPESDGKPMAESDLTRDLMVECIETLQDHFARVRPDTYVSGNLLLYYERGNRKAVVAPDVLVTLGIGGHKRRTYKTWVEGKVPDLVVEISSESTWQHDMLFKSMLYFNLGVREYVLFDSTASRFDEGPLLVLARDTLVYRTVEPDDRGRFFSEALGLELAAEDGHLRFYEPETGLRLRTRIERAAEAERAKAEAEQTAAAERTRREQAEERLRQLEARLGDAEPRERD